MTRDRCSTCGLSRTALSHSLSLSLRYFLSLILSFSLFFSISTLLLSFTLLSSPLSLSSLLSPLSLSYPHPPLPQSLSCQSQRTPIHSFLLLSYSPSQPTLACLGDFLLQSDSIVQLPCRHLYLFSYCLIPSSHDPLKVWGTRGVDLFSSPVYRAVFPSPR